MTPEVRLKAPLMKAILEECFPGADVQMESVLNGFLFQIVIWYFHVEFSLTSWKMAHVDKPGEILATFEFRAPKERAIRIREEKFDSEEKLRAFADGVKTYLLGINAAITTAFDSPFGGGASDIFDDRLKH